MPFRLQISSDPNNPNWKNPAEISIYDNGWKTTKVGYVYDMGWKVVYPDPIIPSITSIFAGAFGDRYEVNWDVRLINCDYIEAYLYSGTTQTNLLDTQTIQVDENSVVDTRIEFGGLANNTTYNIKLIGYSITENTTAVFSGPITTTNVIIPTVNITSMVPNSNLSSVQINWTSTDQYDYEISIFSVSDNVRRFGPIFASPPLPNSNQSYTATFQQQPGTQYRVELRVYSNSIDPAQDSDFYTTPSTPAPSYSNFIVTGATCNSLSVSWNAQNYTSGTIEIWTITATPESSPGKGSLVESHSFTSLSSRTFTGLNSSNTYAFTLILNGTTTITSDRIGSFGSILPSLTGNTLAASANAPTNLTATSDYWGKGASFTWTAATANCTTVSGYRLEYKLSTSSTWTNLSNSIASNATSFAIGSEFDSIFLPNRTYNFRLYAKTDSYGEGPPASVNLTMNNNPYAVQITGTNTIETSSTSTLTAQLVNAAYENISRSGFVISWSFIAGLPPGAAGSSVSPTSSTTNSSGQATTTFSSSTTSGTGTVYATTSGISTFGGGQRAMTVTLRAGLTPILSATRTNFGYDVTHSNYNSSWSYSGTVSNGGFNFDGVWGDGFYTIVIPPLNTAAPVASRNALVSVTCTSGTWTTLPSATTQVTSTRPGYFEGIGQVTNSPTGSLSFSYTWYFGNGAVAGSGQTLSITSAMRGRNMYCIVIATRTGGIQGFQAQSNTIAIPA